MQPFRMSNLVMLAALVCTGAAIKCYVGEEGNHTSLDCTGSCVRFTVTQGSKQNTTFSCFPTRLKQVCSEETSEGVRYELCSCNSDYCTTLSPTTFSPTTASHTTVEGAAIRCYVGFEGTDDSMECAGSCVRDTVSKEGEKIIIRLGCYPTREKEGCSHTTTEGVRIDACICNSNYCNTSTPISLPSLLLLIPLLSPFIPHIL